MQQSLIEGTCPEGPLADHLEAHQRVGLGEASDRRIASYSKGMRQKLKLAQALLDVPAVGVDTSSGVEPLPRPAGRPFKDPLKVALDDPDGDGYWIFTSLSLYLPPERLEGHYRLQDSQEAYWQSLAAANSRLMPLEGRNYLE